MFTRVRLSVCLLARLLKNVCMDLVPRARTATGQRSFTVNEPATWNRLPPALRSPDLSESTFKRTLKTPVLNLPAPLRRLHDFGVAYKYPDLLTYLH